MINYEIGFAENNRFNVRRMNYMGRIPGENGERIGRMILPETYGTRHEAQAVCDLYNKDITIVKNIFTATLGESVFINPLQ